MARQILQLHEVEAFVERNKYQFPKSDWMLSRCVDGRYEPSDTLEPLAKPGADAGDLLVIKATCEEYGIEFRDDDIIDTLTEAVGGVKNIRFHTDEHAEHDKLGTARGCGHLKQASMDPDIYGVKLKDNEFIFNSLENLKQRGALETVLKGDHLEGAVLIIKSDTYSVKPMENNKGLVTQVFVYQKTLDNKRRRLIAEKLSEKAIGSFKPETEYLYQVLSEVSDKQLMETLSRLAKGLPVFDVKIDQEGNLEVVEK